MPDMIVTQALAMLAFDGDDVERAFAVVRDPAHAHFLTDTCRLVGVPLDREAAVTVQPPAATSFGCRSRCGNDGIECRDNKQQRDDTHRGDIASRAVAATPTITAAAAVDSAFSGTVESTGTSDSGATLRLRLEEFYVGLLHGFLALDTAESNAFGAALLGAMQRRDASALQSTHESKREQQHTNNFTLCTLSAL